MPIVEDATYRELYFNEAPPPSLRELDGQNLVIHLNSFSKVMAPGLRLGWLSAAPSIIDQIAIIKQRLDPHTQNLVQFAMARLIREGQLRRASEDAARRARASLCGRCSTSVQRHVPPVSLRFARPSGRVIPVVPAVAPGRAPVRCSIARLPRGVAFVPGHAFYSDPAGESELRLCFSSVLPTTIDDAVKRLAKALSESGSLSRRELVPIA